MSRTGLVLVLCVVALATLGAWAAYDGYAQGHGPSAGGTSLAADQAPEPTTPASEPTGCGAACGKHGEAQCGKQCGPDGEGGCGAGHGEAQRGKHGGRGREGGCGGGHGGNGGGCPRAD